LKLGMTPCYGAGTSNSIASIKVNDCMQCGEIECVSC
jgi:hypothetical protein